MWRTVSVYTCYYRYINTYLWCDRYSLVPRSALSSHGFPRDLNKTSKRISENVRETRHRVNTVHIAILKLSESDISLRSRLSPSGVFVCRSSKLRSPSTLSLWSRLAMQITPVFFFFFFATLDPETRLSLNSTLSGSSQITLARFSFVVLDVVSLHRESSRFLQRRHWV